MKNLILIIAMILSLGLSGCSSVIDGEKNLENKKWIEDINHLDKELREKHPDLFRYITEDKWVENLDNLKNDVKKISDQDIVLRIAQIVSSIQDAHTAIDPVDLLTPIEEEKMDIDDRIEFPIKCEYFEDGLRVIQCSKEYKEILGYKLLSINGIEIEEVMKRLYSLTFHDNEQHAKERAKTYMQLYEFLNFLEIVHSEEAEYVFEDENNNKVSLNIKAEKFKDINYTDIEHKEFKTDKKPEGESDFYWFTHFEEDKILYFQYNRILSSTGVGSAYKGAEKYPDYFEFLNRLLDKINDTEFDKLVIDLRKNPGGSMPLVNTSVELLKHRTDLRNEDIVLITGKATGSASVQLAFSLQNSLGAIVIGEETGGNVNFFTTEQELIVLPNSKLSIAHPSYARNNSKNHEGGVKPDIEIIQTYEDYLNGVDTCYEYVRNIDKFCYGGTYEN